MHVAQKTTFHAKTKFIAVVAVAIALRAGLPLFALAVAKPRPQFDEPDTAGYLRVAAEWLRTGRFAVNGEPEIVRTPGYPLLLLPGVAADRVNLVTITLQILSACVTLWLIYRMAMQLFNRRVGIAHQANASGRCPPDGSPSDCVHEETKSAFNAQKTAFIAAWLFACEPMSVLYTSKMLSETFFTTLLIAGLWQLMGYVASQSRRQLMAAVVCIVAAAYVRPIAYYLPVWMALTLFVVLWKQAPNRRRLASDVVAFLALALVLIVPWQVRNWLEADYSGFSAITDQNLYFYEGLPVALAVEGRTPAQRELARIEAGEADLAVYLRQHPEQADWTAAQHYRYLRREAMKTLLAHPAATAKIHLAGIIHMLTDSGRNAWLSYFGLSVADTPGEVGPDGFWQRLIVAGRQRPLVLAIHLLLAAILATYLLLALAGTLGSLRQPEALLLLSVALYLLLLSGGDAGYHRFRVPLTPLIAVFAAQGYQALSWLVTAANRCLTRATARL